MSTSVTPLTIGKLATAAAVGRETIRYYERKGLLDEPPRSEAGYRHYPPDAVDRLRFIRRAQELGFTLKEARANRVTVEEKIDDLRRIGEALERLVEKCEARQPTSDCPILEELEDRS